MHTSIRGFVFIVMSVVIVCGTARTTIARQDGSPLTPKTLAAALDAKPAGADADRLAEQVRAYFGGREALVKGAPAKIDELTVAWAIEAPSLPPNAVVRVSADIGNGFNVALTPIGTSGV